MPMALLFKKNYLAMVNNAARGENHLFRNFFIAVDGAETDVLENGGLGCATVVSSILYLQNPALEFAAKSRWISSTHANVLAAERDMVQNGWQQVSELREGAVITWEQKPGADGALHWHMGFFIGNGRAISNGSNSTLMPEEHHYTYDGTRNIARIWWHPVLEGE